MPWRLSPRTEGTSATASCCRSGEDMRNPALLRTSRRQVAQTWRPEVVPPSSARGLFVGVGWRRSRRWRLGWLRRGFQTSRVSGARPGGSSCAGSSGAGHGSGSGALDGFGTDLVAGLERGGPHEPARLGLLECPAAVGFEHVIVAAQRSQISRDGLRRPAGRRWCGPGRSASTDADTPAPHTFGRGSGRGGATRYGAAAHRDGHPVLAHGHRGLPSCHSRSLVDAHRLSDWSRWACGGRWVPTAVRLAACSGAARVGALAGREGPGEAAAGGRGVDAARLRPLRRGARPGGGGGPAGARRPSEPAGGAEDIGERRADDRPLGGERDTSAVGTTVTSRSRSQSPGDRSERDTTVVRPAVASLSE